MNIDFLITEVQTAKMNKGLNRDILTNGTDHSTDKKVRKSRVFR